MRKIVITQTAIWEQDIPELSNLEDEVDAIMETDPDYTTTEVEEL